MKILLKAWGPLLLALALIASPFLLVPAHAQLITNGGFETTTGWTYGGGSAQTAGTVLTPAHSGSFYGLIATGGGTISQSVNISTAGTYQLSFYLAPQISLSLLGNVTFNVNINGTNFPLAYAIVNILGLGPYNLFTVTANLPVGVTSIIFTNTSSGLLQAPLRLDDVSLVQIPGPVPGMSMISYLAVAFLGLMLGRRQIINRLRWIRGRLSARGQ